MKIRLANPQDAKEMLRIQKSVLQENHYLITNLEEFSQTVVGQMTWIEAKQSNEREVIFVAELNDKVVGWIDFQSPERQKLQHTGSFGMMVDQHSRGTGIGKALLSALLQWAENNPHIEKVCLGVFSTNENAIALYKKMGFTEEGRKIKEFKVNDYYIDDLLMYKFVGRT